MLISYRKSGDGDYEKPYLEAKRKIDVLCGLIVSGKMYRETAEGIYENIEREFIESNSEDSELFGLVYRNRINRLCEQFCPKPDNEE